MDQKTHRVLIVRILIIPANRKLMLEVPSHLLNKITFYILKWVFYFLQFENNEEKNVPCLIFVHHYHQLSRGHTQQAGLGANQVSRILSTAAITGQKIDPDLILKNKIFLSKPEQSSKEINCFLCRSGQQYEKSKDAWGS